MKTSIKITRIPASNRRSRSVFKRSGEEERAWLLIFLPVTLAQHANNNNISSSYDLPLPEHENEDGRHSDNNIQTLLLPDQLERKMNAVLTKSRTFMDEAGVHVMRAAVGFLEWRENNSDNAAFAPLLLLPIEIEKRLFRATYWVKGIEEEISDNEVLNQKLELDFT